MSVTTYVLKGFIENNAFLDATPGAVSTIGELSTLSSTYSTTKAEYFQESISPDLTLTTFTSNDSSTGNVQVPQNLVTQILEIAAWVFAQTQAIPNPGKIAAATITAGLLAQFETSAQNFTCGNMVTDGTYWVPEWVQWENTTDSTYGSIATGKANIIKIWFDDASFKTEYDGYQIVVIPPITPLDNFFTTSANVLALIDGVSYIENINNIQAAKNGNPETVLVGETYDYVDPTNQTNLIPTNWSLLIYGPAGNNIDAIQNALINYILANSSHTQAEWTNILPSLFKQTEFTLIPMWDQYAIPNRNQVTGIYSPQANASRALSMMNSVAQAYPAAHIASNTVVQSFPYNCVALVSCGSPNNSGNNFQLEDVYLDLLSVPSTNVNFSKMSQATQTFFLMLDQMLIAAESLTEYGNVPVGMSTLMRDGIFYLVSTLNNINYLMVCKSNFPLANVNGFGSDGVWSSGSTGSDGSSGSGSDGSSGSSGSGVTNTLNPDRLGNNGTLTNNNLTLSTSGSSWTAAQSLLGAKTGQFYVEATVNKIGAGVALGLCNGVESMNAFIGNDPSGIVAYDEVITSVNSGVFTNGAFVSAGTTATEGHFQMVAGDVIGIAVNLTEQLVWFYNAQTGLWNNDVLANQNPVGNIGGISIQSLVNAGYQDIVYLAVGVMSGNDQITVNLGATTFAHTQPSGYASWADTSGQVVTS
jgi:uncharacterized membrane protein YgcG